ncbi:DNA repair protein RecN [Brevundimonas sp. 2R-24]|uniref:DNA repair protein RecN n=1 Tax=Peiella sedimenti TaxID=3061083 RepID=A0ABT8SN04_9CAUL|nr:DNA repair protein RecN [Caulobacteraceae bacterium XZ-24]
MLTALSIRDIVLVEALDLEIRPGLTVLTGETGAGKSIILDALGLALGARGDPGLVRPGAKQASVTAVFAPPAGHQVLSALDEAGIEAPEDGTLLLRRTVGADGRSRAFVNDQPVGVGVLKSVGEHLVEVHGQHETVGLLDARTHRGLLDDFGGLERQVAAVGEAHSALKAARGELERLSREATNAEAQRETLAEQLAELDRLAPRAGEEQALAEERALLAAGEKALAEVSQARDLLGGDRLAHSLAQALRALERGRERALQAGAGEDHRALKALASAAEAVDRTLIEAQEASALVDEAAAAFDIDPARLETAEERLFALRAMARRLGVGVEALPDERARIAHLLNLVEDSAQAMKAAEEALERATVAYDAAAAALTMGRRAAAARLHEAVAAELGPLKLDKARFRAVVSPLPEERRGAFGADQVLFEIAANPGAPFGPLNAVASGGELARVALALKAAMAGRTAASPVMIFDEVDQGVGGAVADAVGRRLDRLAEGGQVLVVTHSPQVAARGASHLKVVKRLASDQVRTDVQSLEGEARLEELARMLSGAEVTDAARAAAKALLGA